MSPSYYDAPTEEQRPHPQSGASDLHSAEFLGESDEKPFRPADVAVAADHGPFNIAIDDGSHISDHQAITLRALLKHVRAGCVYVIEDVHASLKKPTATRKADYGEDIWPDFVMTLFQKLRYGPASGDTAGARLALDVFPVTEQLIVGERALAIRTRSPR